MSIQITRPWLRPALAGLVLTSITIGSLGSGSVISGYIDSCVLAYKQSQWKENFEKGKISFSETNYAKAQTHFQEALKNCDKKSHAESYRQTLKWLGLSIYEKQDDCAAKYYLETYLAMTRNSFGHMHKETADAALINAHLYERLGLYFHADQLYREAINVRKEVLDALDTQYMSALTDYANFLCLRCRFDEAEPLAQEALEVNKHDFGLHHKITLESMKCLANVYTRQRKYEKAEHLYNRCVELSRSLYGEITPSTAQCYVGLANVFDAQGQYQESVPMYIGAIEILQKSFGRNEAQLLNAKLYLARSYDTQEKFELANPLHEECLSLSIRRFGQEHPLTANVYNKHARHYFLMHDYDKAWELQKQDYDILMRTSGPDDYFTRESKKSLMMVANLRKCFYGCRLPLVRH